MQTSGGKRLISMALSTQQRHQELSGIIQAKPSDQAGTGSISVFDTAESVQQIQDFWEWGQNSPTNDRLYFLNELANRKEIVEPRILALSMGNSLVSIVIARIQVAPLGLYFGYRLLNWPRVRMLEIVQNGILGDSTESSCQSLLSAIFDTLTEKEATLAVFKNLPLDSIMYRVINSRVKSPRCGLQRATLWQLALPNSYNEFLKSLSKRTRATSVRYSNLLSKKYGSENIVIRCFQKPDDIEAIFQDTEAVAQKAWQRGIEKGFVNDTETRGKYEIALERHQLRAFILYLAGVPVAFWHGFCVGNIFFAEFTGFDPGYIQDRPGAFLLQKVIEQLCEDEKIEMIDFGWGDHEYKRHYCRRGIEVADVYLYGPGLYCRALSTLKSGFDGAKIRAKNLLNQARVLDRLRKFARDRARISISSRDS